MLTRVVAWVREGYPAGVPEHDYVPLLALLRRRLTDQDVQDITRDLIAAGVLPADRIDIGALVLRVTDELPSPEDIERVSERLRSKGWPTDLGPQDEPSVELDEPSVEQDEPSVEPGDGSAD